MLKFLTKTMNKFLLWHYTTPKKMMTEISNMSDDRLVFLARSPGEIAGDGSERNFQMRAIDRELRKRGLISFADKSLDKSEHRKYTTRYEDLCQ